MPELCHPRAQELGKISHLPRRAFARPPPSAARLLEMTAGGRKESAGDVQEEAAGGTPTFTQQQERGATGKAAAHAVVVAAGRRAPESPLRAGLQEFRGCVGLMEFCSQPGRSWRGSEEGCREELEVSAGCLD